VFVELMPLLKERTLLITIARVDERVKINVIPTKVKEGEDHSLTTPLSLTGSAEDSLALLGGCFGTGRFLVTADSSASDRLVGVQALRVDSKSWRCLPNRSKAK